MWVGVGQIFESGARARANLFIFFGMVRTIPSKKQKKVTRAIPAARADPKSKTILSFFCKVMVHALGLRPAQPSPAQPSPAQFSPAQLSSAQPSQELSSGSGELSAEG